MIEIPAISVVVPCYQSEATVGQTLSSVKEQSHDQWECVIVNDGSTDRGPDIARTFAECDRRFRVVDRENGGLSAARNTGISACIGELLIFLDADDILYPNAMSSFVNALAASPSAGMAVSDFSFVDANLAVIANSSPAESFSFETVCMGGPFPVHSCCLRRSVLNSTGGFDTTLHACEDWDLWLRAARIGVKAKRIHTALVAYRKSNSSMSGNARRMFEAHRDVLARIDKRDPRIQGSFTTQATANADSAAVIRAETFCIYIGRAIVANDKSLLNETVSEVRHVSSTCAPQSSIAFSFFLYGMLYETGRWAEAKVTGLLGSLYKLLPAVVWVNEQLPELELLKQLETAIVREVEGAKAERDAVLQSMSYRIGRVLTALKPW